MVCLLVLTGGLKSTLLKLAEFETGLNIPELPSQGGLRLQPLWGCGPWFVRVARLLRCHSCGLRILLRTTASLVPSLSRPAIPSCPEGSRKSQQWRLMPGYH